MLADAQRWGMQHRTGQPAGVPAAQRCRTTSNNCASASRPACSFRRVALQRQGARGCAAIADSSGAMRPRPRQIVLPVGTGTTLAGLAASLDDSYEVIGISALKGATDLEQRVQGLLVRPGDPTATRAGVSCTSSTAVALLASMRALREFMLAFEGIHGVPLDPVYTGKMLFAIHQLRARDEWSSAVPMLAIHTGGLQGRRGYPWLT